MEDALRDGVDLRGASFAGANLTGANLSEARLEEIQFNRASLFNACLCGSTLSASDFSGALFGGTDIVDCDLGECRFSGRSVLGLHFAESRSMSGCSFTHGSITSAMAQPPVVVQGLHLITALFDDDILIGQAVYACTRGIWRLREGRSDPGAVLPHELFRIVSLLQTLRPAHSPYSCIAMQKSTER